MFFSQKVRFCLRDLIAVEGSIDGALHLAVQAIQQGRIILDSFLKGDNVIP